MCKSAKILIVFLAAFSSSSASCSLGDLSCCVSHFSFIAPFGITLSEYLLTGVCTQEDATVDCLHDFVEDCLKIETDRKNVEDTANKTAAFISFELCANTSDFKTQLKEKEACILNSSSEFQACYNKSVTPIIVDNGMDNSTKECCFYKNLRDCASKTVEDRCGAEARGLIDKMVKNINGVVLEWDCERDFDQCPKSADDNSSSMTLASSVLLSLCSILAVLRFFLL